MEKQLIAQANTLLKEIEELGKIKSLPNGGPSRAIHFEVVQHYGEGTRKVRIGREHNERLFLEVSKILSELEVELAAL